MQCLVNKILKQVILDIFVIKQNYIGQSGHD